MKSVMKKFLSLIVLLSVFLIQIHGVTHSNSDNHNKNHSCAICEIQSHQTSITPSTLVFDLAAHSVVEKFTLNSINEFVLKSFISNSISPRAPPVI